MSKRERLRKGVFEMVKRGHLTLKQAAHQIGVSYRQARRIYQAYLKEGDAGLLHKNRDQQSNRKHPHRETIIERYKARYEGFGPTLASEYLAKEGYKVDHDTLRLWLITEGLWIKKRQGKLHHPRRERRAQFGELVQIDGSIHDWFEEGRHRCLLNMVDDATGKTLALMDDGETTRVLFKTLWRWIDLYGVPLAAYVDLKNLYVAPRDGLSNFQKACNKLDIEVIKAYSPQAKGRVERNHRVYQDRFFKALRLEGIKTIDAANAFLEQVFLDELNAKFERLPRNALSAHRSASGLDLNQILCWESERHIQHDWSFSYEGQLYQVKKAPGEAIAPRSTLIIRRHLNGDMSVWHHNKAVQYALITKEQLLHQREQRAPLTKPVYQRTPRPKPHRDNACLFRSSPSTAQREQEIKQGYSMPFGH